MAKKPRKRFKSVDERHMRDVILEELDRRCPTEESCIKELRRYIPDSNKCPDCNRLVEEDPKNARRYHCTHCGRRGSYTANTFFDGIKCPRAWLAALAFFNGGVKINANQFYRLVGIAYSTAHQMFLKIQMVMSEELEAQDNVVKLDAQQFRFAVGKSSRLTPSHLKPSEETYFDESKLPADVKIKSHSTAENEQLVKLAVIREKFPHVDDVLKYFEKGKQVQIANVEYLLDIYGYKMSMLMDELTRNNFVIDLGWSWYVLYEQDYIDPSKPCLCAESGKRQCPFHTHEKEVLAKKKAREVKEKEAREKALRILAEQEEESHIPIYPLGTVSERDRTLVRKRIRRIIRFIYRQFGSVSRKYLQTYVARIWFEMDWRFWRGGKLARACSTHAKISPEEIRNYNTKANVVMMLPKGTHLPAPDATDDADSIDDNEDMEEQRAG